MCNSKCPADLRKVFIFGFFFVTWDKELNSNDKNEIIYVNLFFVVVVVVDLVIVCIVRVCDRQNVTEIFFFLYKYKN